MTHSKLLPLAIAASTFAAALPAYAAAPDKVRVVVAFQPGAAAAVRSAAAAAHGAVAHEIYGMDAMAIEVPPQALQGLQHNPNVLYIEQDEKRYPMALRKAGGTPGNSAQTIPYGISMVQADQLSDASAGNRKLCIVDSGIDANHEDIIGNNLTGEWDKGTGWWYTDEDQHGTHVAGTIAAVNNAIGVVGVNPNKQLKLHIVKVFGADGWAYSSTLATAVNKCGAAGANIISMSLGGGKPTKTEEKAFNALAAKNVLSIAAAGNDGNTAISYPAGYASVVSVGALDANMNWADFSQYNSKVELSAPGVAVTSTVPMGTGADSALTVGNKSYAAGDMEGSPKSTASAPLADFGLGDKVDASVSGKICLIQRGSIDFATKVSNCQTSGGKGAIVYNNVAGGFGGTLGTTVTNIPSVSASQADGQAMLGQSGQVATITITPSNYAVWDGTSMATPHVSAVAALVWSLHINCTAAQLRTSLDLSARDLGTPGRDDKFGYGLVQAKAAHDRITAKGCGK
ncbi:S8 family serine peptidase [Pseudoduganella sp. RAF53_2]|uniref:S8 family serine peptidase n=1 Tax=unclassified Pseudoduganella TaxID=2637179 RepID=UPI003F9BC421